MQKETLESLQEYCAANNRVCPLPTKWNDMFNMLDDHEKLDLPLILNGWEMSSPLEKKLRFGEHIKSASTNNQLDEVGKYLRSLSEDDWAHYGEI